MQAYSIKQRSANQEASLEMKVCHAVNLTSSPDTTPLKQSPGQRCPQPALSPFTTLTSVHVTDITSEPCDFIHSSKDFSYILTGD